jgi:hypothetical protein
VLTFAKVEGAGGRTAAASVGTPGNGAGKKLTEGAAYSITRRPANSSRSAGIMQPQARAMSPANEVERVDPNALFGSVGNQALTEILSALGTTRSTFRQKTGEIARASL